MLRPGGRLATADLLVVNARPKQWLRRLGNKIFRTPTTNMYPRSGYARRLEDAGFTDIRVETIADKVFAPSLVRSQAAPHSGGPRANESVHSVGMDIFNCLLGAQRV